MEIYLKKTWPENYRIWNKKLFLIDLSDRIFEYSIAVLAYRLFNLIEIGPSLQLDIGQ